MEQNTNPNSNMNPKVPNQSSHKKVEIIWSAVILVIAAAILVLWLTRSKVATSPSTTASSTQAQELDMSKLLSNPSNPPAWFPAGLPIEVQNITEAKYINYPDQKVSSYSIVYNTARQIEEMYVVYGNYLKDNDFKITTQTKNQRYMAYQATKDNTHLNIMLVSSSGGTIVNIGIGVGQQ